MKPFITMCHVHGSSSVLCRIKWKLEEGILKPSNFHTSYDGIYLDDITFRKHYILALKHAKSVTS